MSIPINKLVSVTPRIIGGGTAGLAFDCLSLTENVLAPFGKVMTFVSADSVGEYFGFDSTEYEMAQVYFVADSNSTKKPYRIYFGRVAIDAASDATLIGETPAEMSVITAITTGTLSLTINSVAVNLTGIDFTGDVSYSDAAATIQTALSTSGTIAYNNGRFTITQAGGENGGSITVATGTVAVALGLTADAGATVSTGSAVETPAAALARIMQITTNWVTLCHVTEYSEANKKAIAAYLEGKNPRFSYQFVDESSACETFDNPLCVEQVLTAYKGVAFIYKEYKQAFFVAGVIASLDFGQTNGRKTLAYRASSLLLPNVTDETIAAALESNGVNFYGSYSSASATFSFFQPGCNSGPAKWIDTYVGQIYLKDGLELAWVDLLSGSNTLPYNTAGYSALSSAAQDVINRALNFGTIRKGISLSNAQKALLLQEAGIDISDDLTNNGYYLQIKDPTTIVRAERGSPIINLWYTDGGSVHRIQASSTGVL